MSRRQSLAVFLLLLSFGLINSWSVRADIVEGRDYTVVANPQPTESAEKIEVLEFFWYGCPHCYSLHPHLKAWLKNMPSDVSFRYVPAILRANWVSGAKLFYTVESKASIERNLKIPIDLLQYRITLPDQRK